MVDVAEDTTTVGVVELSSRIRERVVSAADVLEAYIARIERWNGDLLAVVRLDLARARARAASADLALSGGKLFGPLHGVPFTLQDVVPVAGIGASAGGKKTQQSALESGVIARRLMGAGAIFLGKTNVSVDIQTRSELAGLTRNPHDATRSAGGRSGGPAAAVAACFSSFDVGLDVDGSLRVAAHFCGVSALRPTMHRLPVADLVVSPPGWPRLDRLFNTAGPIARRPQDIELLFRVLAGADPSDPEVPPVPVTSGLGVDLRGLRVARIPTEAGVPVASSVEHAMNGSVRALLDAGAVVTDAVPLPLGEVASAIRRHAPVTMSLISRMEVPPESLLPASVSPPTPYQVAELLAERDRFIAAYERFMESYDVVLAPAANVTAMVPGPPGDAIELDGRLVAPSSVAEWSLLATFVGAPSFVLPVGRTPGGMPIGAQLLGARFRDELILATASALERLLEQSPVAALS
jgi:amidase